MKHHSPATSYERAFPFIWGGSSAMMVAEGLNAFIAVAITLCCIAMLEKWQVCKDTQIKTHNAAWTWQLLAAGMMLWVYGHAAGRNGASASGISLAGLTLCRTIFHGISFSISGQPDSESESRQDNLKPGSNLSVSGDDLIKKTAQGGYEINIHELAAVISKSRAVSKPHNIPQVTQETGQTDHPSSNVVSPSIAEFKPHSRHVKTILNEYVLPWIKERSPLDGILCLLKILDANAEIPSVISEEDLSQCEPYNVHYEALHRVSLAEHTMHVVREGFLLVKEHFGDTGLYTVWPRLAVSIIAHDLVKIPEKRLYHGYAKLDHPGISAEILKECLGKNPALSKECSEVVLYHHGSPPSGFSSIQGLEILKQADARARRKELETALSHLKPWSDISLEDVAKELTSAILDIIRAGDTARDLFYLNHNKGYMYVNPDVLIEILQTMARDTYLWPEIYSPDSRMAEKALRQFMNRKMKPAGWLTKNFSQDRFLWLKIDKMGKVTGPRPFAELLFMKYVQTAGIKPSAILKPWRNSFLGKCRVLRE